MREEGDRSPACRGVYDRTKVAHLARQKSETFLRRSAASGMSRQALPSGEMAAEATTNQLAFPPPFWGKGWQKPFPRSHATRVRPAAERGRSARARRSANEALSLHCGRPGDFLQTPDGRAGCVRRPCSGRPCAKAPGRLSRRPVNFTLFWNFFLTARTIVVALTAQVTRAPSLRASLSALGTVMVEVISRPLQSTTTSTAT